jgi:DNA-binding LytR/AlgR family response regulator
LWPELDIVGMAANGIEAREMIEACVRVAFLDIRMPGLTGLEVAQRLSPAARAACRVVFVTAYDEFAVQAFEREAVDYLLKPVSRRSPRRRPWNACGAGRRWRHRTICCSACRR